MAQSSLPANIQAHIQGDISGQVAIGNNIIQIGSVHGGVVNIVAPEQQPRPRPRPSPVFLRPQPVPELLDREAELGEAVSALQSDLPVEFSGEEGVGKTTLVRHMAYHSSADRFPDGVVYHFVRHKPIPDMLQSLFDAFYESDAPLKPTDAEIRHSLENKRALIILDDVELPRAEVEALMDAAPGCTFVLASRKRRLWREGRAVALHGLPLDDAVALVERELGRPLAQEERPAAEDLCTALEGHPLRILQAVALAQEEGRSLAEMAQQMQAPDASNVLVTENLASLSESEQRILAALAALAGAPLDADHLASLAGLADAAPILEKLQGRGLVQAHSPRYSLAGALDEDLEQRWNLGPWRERALTHFATWAEDHRSEPDRLLEEAEAILEVLKWGVGAGRWTDILRLGQAVEGALTLGGQWGGWAQALEWALQAAQALGNQAAEAWALHQVGTRALCLGEADAARTSLTQALEMREALGDRIGAAITRHNLDLLLGPLPPPEEPPEPPPEPPSGGLSLPIIALVSVVLVAVVGVVLVLVGGGFVVCPGWLCPPTPPPPRPTPPLRPLEARVDIWLEADCDREYSYGYQTRLLVEANVDGSALIGLDEESFEETWLTPGERWTESWTFEDLEPGWHGFWVELWDESGAFLARDDCSFTLVEGPVSAPEVFIWLEDGCDAEYSFGHQTRVFVEASVEGDAEIGLDDWSLEKVSLRPGQPQDMPWTLGEEGSGEHQFWVVLTDESGGFLAEAFCTYALVEEDDRIPPPAPTPLEPGRPDPEESGFLDPCEVRLVWTAVQDNPGGSGIESYWISVEYFSVAERWEYVTELDTPDTSLDLTPVIAEYREKGGFYTYRWNVWAVDIAGNDSEASPWYYFHCPLE